MDSKQFPLVTNKEVLGKRSGVTRRLALVLFRKDLRVDDHPALNFAADNNFETLGLYVLDEEASNKWPIGSASRWWLHESLQSLQHSINRLGFSLLLRKGNTEEIVSETCKEFGVTDILLSRCYEAASKSTEVNLQSIAKSLGLEFRSFNASLLYEPWEILKQDGGAFQVFTPFWKKICTIDEVSYPRDAPKTLSGPKLSKENQQSIEALNLRDPRGWDHKFYEFWKPGKAGLDEALEKLPARIVDYIHDRDRPILSGTSQLSPYLHFGELSPRRLWHLLQSLPPSQSRESFLRQLGWREFSHHLLFHFPQMIDRPLRESFNNFPWLNDPEALRTWQKGHTGFPILDAGMRQLWNTGWMHNRVRMIVGSFLVKDLGISWIEGARWFWETLVDADLAQNTMGWQWIAGCGADAAPYFRIFNPLLQSQKFDPDGEYIRKWVPELSRMPKEGIHAPWKLSPIELASAGVRLGDNYPNPIVDHAKARARALKAFSERKV